MKKSIMVAAVLGSEFLRTGNQVAVRWDSLGTLKGIV
jgi:hypothetical protein